MKGKHGITVRFDKPLYDLIVSGACAENRTQSNFIENILSLVLKGASDRGTETDLSKSLALKMNPVSERLRQKLLSDIVKNHGE
jgi:hypothetical protein